jgi:hypothetical protein
MAHCIIHQPEIDPNSPSRAELSFKTLLTALSAALPLNKFRSRKKAIKHMWHFSKNIFSLSFGPLRVYLHINESINNFTLFSHPIYEIEREKGKKVQKTQFQFQI